LTKKVNFGQFIKKSGGKALYCPIVQNKLASLRRLMVKPERIWFKSVSGHKLAGVLHLPEEPTNKAVIICHGFTGDKDEGIIKNYARYLTKEGYAAFRFDFFAHNESPGKFENLTIKEEISDLEAAINLMSGRFDKIGLVGHSLGGLIASTQANKANALVLWAPALYVYQNFKHIFSYYVQNGVQQLEKQGYLLLSTRYWGWDWNYTYSKFKVSRKLWQEMKSFDTEGLLKKIKIPTTIIQGNVDDVTEEKYAKLVHSKLKVRERSLHILRGVDHDFSTKQRDLFELTTAHFNRYLK
jgi:esterase/lipase